jgi:hypothetical protein
MKLMDTMKWRGQGKPRHPVRMKLLLVIMRFCLAAHLAGKNAETMLGSGGHALKRFFERTRSSKLLLMCAIRGTGSIVGIGGQYIVIDAQDASYIEKYSYTLAGTDPEILAKLLHAYQAEYEHMRGHYGDLVQPTEYSLANLPVRGPFKKLITIRARQPKLHDFVDIFDTSAAALLSAPTHTLRTDLATLTTTTRSWIQENKWLDILGPNNIVITTDNDSLRIRIIDTEAYVPEYLLETNPMVGKPYREIFIERLQLIEGFINPMLIALVVVGSLFVISNHFNMLHTRPLVDRGWDIIEDASEKLFD